MNGYDFGECRDSHISCDFTTRDTLGVGHGDTRWWCFRVDLDRMFEDGYFILDGQCFPFGPGPPQSLGPYFDRMYKLAILAPKIVNVFGFEQGIETGTQSRGALLRYLQGQIDK